MGREEKGTTNLVEVAISSMLDSLNESLLAGKRVWQLQVLLTVGTEASLLDLGKDVDPSAAGRCVGGGAEVPIGLWVGGRDGNDVAADVEVGGIVEGGLEAAAGTGAFLVVVEAEGGGVVEVEVAIDLCDADGEAKENYIDVEHCERRCCAVLILD
jgi:hypothetical protein